MNGSDNQRPGLKEKLVHEMRELLAIFLYLALFFCAFTTYRLLVERELGIAYFHYGFALLKALVLAKVILLNKNIPVVKIFDNRPLIVPTLYKVVLFSLFALASDVLEHAIDSFLHGKSLSEALHEIAGEGRDELLARTLVMLVAFIPFFAFTEMARILGEGKLHALFLGKRPPAN